jgi:hypothetical protein
MALVSTAATVAAALLLPATDPATLDAFYKTVRPAGWWPATARRAGDSAHAPLVRALSSVAKAGACAASLFLALVGLGQWLLPVPGSSAWGAAALVAASVIVTPLWWPTRRGTAREDGRETTAGSDGRGR